MSGKATKVLCLNGGGVKGLSSLLILKRVSEILSDAFEEAGHPELLKDKFRPCTYFDVIVGTSTGGIIALMLARVGVTIQECICGYEKFSKEVFGGSKIVTGVKLLGTAMIRPDGHGNRFDRSHLVKAAQKFLENHNFSMDSPFQAPGVPTCKAILVMARRIKETADKSDDPQPFTRRMSDLVGLPGLIGPSQERTEYKLKAHLLCSDASGHGKNWTLGDAIMATTAAYTIFPPFYKDGEIYEDAADQIHRVSYEDAALIGLNNPAALKGPLQPLIRGLDSHMPQALFLNIGTGMRAEHSYRRSRFGPISFLKGQITDSAPTEAAANDLHNARREKSYFSISGPSDIRGISLHDYRRVSEIERKTIKHLKDVDTILTMKSVAECFIKTDCDYYLPEPDECHLGGSSRGCLFNPSTFIVLREEIDERFIAQTIERLGPGRFQTYQKLAKAAKEKKRNNQPNGLTNWGVNAPTRQSLISLKEELQKIVSFQSELCEEQPDFPISELLVTTAHLQWVAQQYDPAAAKGFRRLLYHLHRSEEIERANGKKVAPCQEISELDYRLALESIADEGRAYSRQ